VSRETDREARLDVVEAVVAQMGPEAFRKLQGRQSEKNRSSRT
jgi:hypothetical protein